MKNVFKLSLVALGFCMAIIATTNSASASDQPGGSCLGDNHNCGTTSNGTVLNGYWTENSGL